jgi:hypothetical protein
MKVEYGPPGIGGVKSLQYVSGDETSGDGFRFDLINSLPFALGGLWGYAEATGRRKLAKQARLASLLAVGVAIIRGIR